MSGPGSAPLGPGSGANLGHPSSRLPHEPLFWGEARPPGLCPLLPSRPPAPEPPALRAESLTLPPPGSHWPASFLSHSPALCDLGESSCEGGLDFAPQPDGPHCPRTPLPLAFGVGLALTCPSFFAEVRHDPSLLPVDGSPLPCHSSTSTRKRHLRPPPAQRLGSSPKTAGLAAQAPAGRTQARVGTGCRAAPFQLRQTVWCGPGVLPMAAGRSPHVGLAVHGVETHP